MTPIKPFAIGLLALIVLGGGAALLGGADPKAIGMMTLVGGGTLAFILGFAAVGLKIMAGMTGMYDAFPGVAERLGGRVVGNVLGERQVSAPGPRGGRWIVELRTSAESYQQAQRGAHQKWTALAWRAKGQTLPKQELILGGSDTVPDLSPEADAALRALAASLPGVKLRLRPANLLVNEDEIGLMWSGYITSPDAMIANIDQALPLLSALVEALATPQR